MGEPEEAPGRSTGEASPGGASAGGTGRAVSQPGQGALAVDQWPVAGDRQAEGSGA